MSIHHVLYGAEHACVRDGSDRLHRWRSGPVRGGTRTGGECARPIRPHGERALERAGITPARGRLEDEDSFRAGGATRSCTPHSRVDAYEHLEAAIDLEVRATQSLLNIAAERHIPIAYTSGIGVVGGTDDVAQEDDEPATPTGMQWRRDIETRVLAAGGVVLRPGFVYGRAGNEILCALIRAERPHRCCRVSG